MSDDAENTTPEARPCAKRGTNLRADGTREHAWCQLPDGHDGPCNGVFSAEPQPNDFGPRRRA